MQPNVRLFYKYLIIIFLAFYCLSFSSLAKPNEGFMPVGKEEKDFSGSTVSCIMQDGRGFIWIGTSEGLNRYDGSIFKEYDESDPGLPSSDIRAVEEDGSGNILVGTSEGLSVYDYSKDVFHQVPGFRCKVNDMVADSRGRIWIGADAPVIFCYDPSSMKCSGIPMDSEGHITGLAIDSSDRICFALSTGGFGSFNISASSFDEFMLAEPSLKIDEEQIVGISFDSRSDDILYIAGKKFGLWEINLRKGVVRQFYRMPKEVEAIGLAEDGQFLWLPMTSGLLKFDISTRSSVVSKLDEVTAICRDSRDALWVGTSSDGLYYQSPYHAGFTEYTALSDGTSLADCGMKSFSSDSRGRIIVVTEKLGNISFNPQTGKLARAGAKVVGGQSLQSDSLFVIEDHPLLSSLLEGFSWDIDCVLEDGRVLLGHNGGLVLFHPEDFELMPGLPYIYVTDLMVDGVSVRPGDNSGLLERNIDVTSHLSFPQGSENFGFRFSAPGYGPLSGYRILCMLEGHDSDWKDVSDELSVCYEDLSSGNYIFHLAVRDLDGKVVGPARSIVIEFGTTSRQLFSGRWLIAIAGLILLFFLAWLVYRKKKNVVSVELLQVPEKPLIPLPPVADQNVSEHVVVVEEEHPEDFNEMLKRIVRANLSNPDFSVQHLEEELRMSRSSLIRRMKTNMDMRPVDYIRKCRLESAARLLRQGGMSIKEVSVRSGFNSSSYFAKCFKEHFGMLPGEFVKESVKK